MAAGPLVSFLMPVYNAAVTVERAVDSILRQRDAPGLEAVVVDDGSTDRTPEILARLAQRDSRVVPVTIPHQGLVAALITGQSRCRGAFLARLDADDIAHPERVKEQLALAGSDPGLGLVGSQVRYFPRRFLREGLLYYENWLNSLLDCRDSPGVVHNRIMRELFIECPLAHPTFFLRREAFDQAGGYRDFQGLPEDYDLCFRIAESGWRLGGVGRVLHYWREHAARSSHTDQRYSEESFRRLKLHYLVKLKLDNGTRPVSICGAGPVGKAWLKDILASGLEVRYLIEVNPRKIGKKIHGVPVVRAEDLTGLKDPGLILGAVGQKGARPGVRALLDLLGYVEGVNYIFVA
ncbi:MAG TPA: glycosyltransferase [archaeon]|nr:glycosyltransferase [archaeon]